MNPVKKSTNIIFLSIFLLVAVFIFLFYRVGDNRFYFNFETTSGIEEEFEESRFNILNPSYERVGTIIDKSETDSYIRVSFDGERIYSVGITPDTKITKAGTPSTFSEIDLYTNVDLIISPLPDSDFFDFIAESLTLHDKEVLNQEERLEMNLRRIQLLNN